jgi:hypothetical protein
MLKAVRVSAHPSRRRQFGLPPNSAFVCTVPEEGACRDPGLRTDFRSRSLGYRKDARDGIKRYRRRRRDDCSSAARQAITGGRMRAFGRWLRK